MEVTTAMPQAAQILDSVHVVAAFHKGDRPCEVREEARLRREKLDPAKTHLREARACQMAEAMCDVYSCTDRESAAAAPNRLCL
ncbi:MAG: hypothetical protein DUD39_13785 [Coriobacteriaceae bacterium]|nr:MAG: hypothetical protein DUD39_13785 [Coriobacteriaceae bacterium]